MDPLHNFRSSLSPYNHERQLSAIHSTASYPSPPHGDPGSAEHRHQRGLGLYGCPLPGSSSRIDTSTAPQSSESSGLFYQQPQTRHSASQFSQASGVFYSDYDPWAGVGEPSSSYSSSPFPSAQITAPENNCSPNGSGIHIPSSHRSSVSSCTPSEVYSQPSSEFVYTPKVKVEDSSDWFSSSRISPAGHRLSSRQNHLSLTHGPYLSSPEAQIPRREDATDWSTLAINLRADTYTDDRHSNETYSEYGDFRGDSAEEQPRISNVARTRKRRQMTTLADATHKCHCGKLFKRHYNLKAHEKTHDLARTKIPCTIPDCPQKFDRKTDLVRHHQTVHEKRKDFRCELCGRSFGRKDIMRRYECAFFATACSTQLNLNLGTTKMAVQSVLKSILGGIQKGEQQLRPGQMQTSYQCQSAISTLGYRNRSLHLLQCSQRSRFLVPDSQQRLLVPNIRVLGRDTPGE
ncbi:MAG: hypothetical protein M1827_002494 [Pycnora praestabilis]|nr:MAG: hypothetical protein M1827_002494 [Pycnora praestabilis]